MPKTSLTDIAVRAIRPPSAGQQTHWDTTLSGFGLRVSQGGTRTWVVMFGAQRHRATIGRYPAVSLADARAEAKRMLAEHTLGRHRPKRISFEDARAVYLSACEQKNKPRTVSDYKRMLHRYGFGRTQLHDITVGDIARKLDRLKHVPSEQHHLYVCYRAFFRWAFRRNFLDQSPVERLHIPTRNRSRDRVLSVGELKAIYTTAVSDRGSYGHIIALLILTGARRGEIAALQWDWINAEDRTIRFPSTVTKNSRAHVIPYGPMTAQILDATPKFDQSPYLFPASRSHVGGHTTTCFNGWGKAKADFDRRCGVSNWTLHDLRRTFASTLAAAGVSLPTIEKMLNHVSGSFGGIVAVYQRYDWMREMRDAVRAYEDYLRDLLSV